MYTYVAYAEYMLYTYSIHIRRHMTVATAPATLEERVQGWAKDLCDALDLNFKKDAIRSHERYLADERSYEPYHTEQLKLIEEGKGNLNRFVAYTGRKYIKIVMQEINRHETEYKDSSVHAFIDKKTGEVYMPAGYNAPTRTGKYPVRWDLRIIKDREYILNPVNCGWAGGYLYDRSHLPSKYV